MADIENDKAMCKRCVTPSARSFPRSFSEHEQVPFFGLLNGESAKREPENQNSQHAQNERSAIVRGTGKMFNVDRKDGRARFPPTSVAVVVNITFTNSPRS